MASRLIPGEQRKRGSGNEVGSFLSKSIKRTIYYTLKKYNRSLPSRTLENHSYGSWNIGLRVEQFVKCISLERLRECIYKSTTRTGREAMVYESYSLSLERLECIYKSTTRTSLSSRVTMVYESFGWCFAYQSDLVSLINKSTTRTTRTGRETRAFVSHSVRHTNIAYLIILVRSRCRIL